MGSERQLVVGDDFPFKLLELHGADDPGTPWDDADVTWTLTETTTDRLISSGSMSLVVGSDSDYEAVVPKADLAAYDANALTGLRVGFEYVLRAKVVKDGAQTSLFLSLKAVKYR